MEVLYHKGTVLSVFPVPEGTENTVVGVLPKGDWLEQEQALYGLVRGVYFAVWLSRAYQLTSREDYLEVTAAGMPGGVAVEAISAAEAAEKGIGSLAEFAAALSARKPVFTAGAVLSAEYTTLGGDLLRLEAGIDKRPAASINSKPVRWEDYKV